MLDLLDHMISLAKLQYVTVPTNEVGHPYQSRVETGSGLILFGSSMSDLVYKISGSDLDSALDHICDQI